MENPRPDKAAVVTEVRNKLEGADAVLLTEYRGLTVGELATLRSALRPAGGEYKVYKNTLVRLAARELGIDIDDALTGPTALAFVSTKADGTAGDISTVAKAITEFAKSQPLLILKGGLLGEKVLDAAGVKALASLPTAPEIYSRLAGAVNGNARGLASVVSGVGRSLAYVLQAAIDARVFAGDPPVDEVAEAPADEVAEAPADEVAEAPADAPDAETPGVETPDAETPESIETAPAVTAEVDDDTPAVPEAAPDSGENTESENSNVEG